MPKNPKIGQLFTLVCQESHHYNLYAKL